MSTHPDSDAISPIAYIESPFKEKFGIPRQSGLIQSVSGYVRFLSPYDQEEAFRGLERFSHIWISFRFHQHPSNTWRPLVRPPRLGGNHKLGVYATRSSFRPNSLGLSLVELKKIHRQSSVCYLEIGCPDLLDGTPVYDIKPYIPYADCRPGATAGFASEAPKPSLTVHFSNSAEENLTQLDTETYPNLGQLIRETVSYDPRPAYKSDDDNKVYAMRLWDLDVRFQVKGKQALVLAIGGSSKHR